jgi:hypothetical protein
MKFPGYVPYRFPIADGPAPPTAEEEGDGCIGGRIGLSRLVFIPAAPFCPATTTEPALFCAEWEGVAECEWEGLGEEEVEPRRA